ncbi:MAG: DUF3037 domain-containing protein [Propionibacteriaceae bacterium]
MAAVNAYDYALLRAVPRVDRGECINIGVIVHCQATETLEALVSIDQERLRALDPGVDVDAVRMAADGVVAACSAPVGTARQNTGLATRFGMLTAPRSTVVQPAPVHAGVGFEPGRTVRQLLERLVR